jgi:hypothetical protein
MLQQSVNTFIERFQDRWETSSSFRATWSTIGSVVVIVFLCSTMYIVSNVASGLLGSQTSQSSKQSPGQNQQAAGTNFTPIPIAPYKQGTAMTTPTAVSVAPSNAATPTPTAPPPSVQPSPSASPTGTSTITVVATQDPNPWVSNGTNNTIKSISTSKPPQSNGVITSISLDFGNNCTQQITQSITLDVTGRYNTAIPVTIPSCFTPNGTSQVTATFTINGQTGSFNNLHIKGP